MTYVVHLEDDGPLREILKVAFEATDPNVNLKQFITGDEVVAHIKPNIQAIDLFVLDIRVPGNLDGVGVARKIREFGSDAPIILTSAYRPPERELITTLSLEWMSKPWHIMEIAQRLVKLAKEQRAKAAKAVVKPPAVNLPASNPPPSNAPVSNAPISDTPAANPPASNAPVSNPPVTKPPSSGKN